VHKRPYRPSPEVRASHDNGAVRVTTPLSDAGDVHRALLVVQRSSSLRGVGRFPRRDSIGRATSSSGQSCPLWHAPSIERLGSIRGLASGARSAKPVRAHSCVVTGGAEVLASATTIGVGFSRGRRLSASRGSTVSGRGKVNRILQVASAVSAVATVLLVAPATGLAKRPVPTASLTFSSNRVDVSTRIRFSYSAKHLPGGASLYLQRDFGTQHVFRNIEKLASRGSTGSAPGLTMGQFRYRIVIARKRLIVGASGTRPVYAYGPVTASQLCHESDLSANDMNWPWGCYPTTIQVGSTVYAAATVDQNENTTPTGPATVTATKTSCRSASITFAAPNSEQFSTIGVQLTQSAADPQSATASYGQVGTLSASITSPDWDLEIWTDTGAYDVYWDAVFNCWSASGHT
jgi:hypothetical protein